MSSCLASGRCESLEGWMPTSGKTAGSEDRGKNSDLRTSRISGELSQLGAREGKMAALVTHPLYRQASMPSEGISKVKSIAFLSRSLGIGEPSLRSLFYCFCLDFISILFVNHSKICEKKP